MYCFRLKPLKKQAFHSPTRPCPSHKQRGSALVWILIAVGLFAALSYVFSQGMRAGEKNIGKERINLYVSDLLTYVRTVKNTVQDLRINGCKDNEISFQKTALDGYTNANAPGDNSCHVFHISGGNMRLNTPERDILDSSYSGSNDYGVYYFPEGTCIYGVGTNSATQCNDDGDEELLMILPWLRRDVCIAINNALGIDNPSGEPPQDLGSAWAVSHPKFTGDFAGDHEILNGTIFSGIQSACFEGGGGATSPPQNTYHFYHVLRAR